MSIPNEQDLSAIRQRADAFVHADPNAETFDTFDELIIAADDRAALLAHVDALTDDIRLFEAMKRGVTVRIQDMADANAELARKLAAAEAALKPFAAMGYANDDPDADEVSWDAMGINSWALLFTSDFARARKFFRDEDLEQFNQERANQAFPEDDADDASALAGNGGA